MDLRGGRMFAGRAGVAAVDMLLVGLALVSLLGLVLFEIFHVRTTDRILGEEDTCARKNLTALRRAMDLAKVLGAADDSTPVTLLDLQTNVIHFKGCFVEVEGHGRGTVLHPVLSENGKVENDGKVKVDFQKGGEMEFGLEDFVPKARLVCPAGGTYSVGALGSLPRCNVPGHGLGH